MEQPALIDRLLASEREGNCRSKHIVNGKELWLISRPLGTRWEWRKRLYHAWLVLRGKASAFQYYADVEEMK